jgi:quercetin dioxygenase-like cupin family protein
VKIVPASAVRSTDAGGSRFTGGVWQAEILPRVRDDGMRAHRFVYAPGARSSWHVHTGEQAIYVVAGRGLVLWQGLEAARLLGPGDWIHVEPGVPHWHGAAPDDTFVHLAVSATGATEWQAAVSEADYRASLPPDLAGPPGQAG